MKTFFRFLLCFFWCFVANAQNPDMYGFLSDFSLNPATNRIVVVQSMSVPTINGNSIIIGNPITNITDSNGMFEITNATTNMLYQITVKAPPAMTTFKIFVPIGLTGSNNMKSNLVADSASTFPAGLVAWSAATTDLRYAPFGTAGQVTVAGTNVSIQTNGANVTINSTGVGVDTNAAHLNTNNTFGAGTTNLFDSAGFSDLTQVDGNFHVDSNGTITDQGTTNLPGWSRLSTNGYVANPISGNLAPAKIFVGNAASNATEQTVSGDATIATNGALTLENTVQARSDLGLSASATNLLISDSNTFFVQLDGSDVTGTQGDRSHPFATPNGAVGAARTLRAGGNTNYFNIQLGVGSWSLTNIPIWPSNNTVITGAGSNLTFLYYYGGEHATGPAIMWNPGVGMRGLFVQCLQPTNWGPVSISNLDQTAVGTLNNSPNSNVLSTNFIEDCMLIAGAHGIQLNPASTNGLSVTYIFNSTLISSYSPIQTAATNAYVFFESSRLYNYWPEPTGRDSSCGIMVTSGHVYGRNSYIYADGATADFTIGIELNVLGTPVSGVSTADLQNILFDIHGNPAADENSVFADDIMLDSSFGATSISYGSSRELTGKSLAINNGFGGAGVLGSVTNTDLLPLKISTGLIGVTNTDGTTTVVTNPAVNASTGFFTGAVTNKGNTGLFTFNALSGDVTNGIVDRGLSTNRLVATISTSAGTVLSNLGSFTDGQTLVADSATAGGFKATNFPSGGGSTSFDPNQFSTNNSLVNLGPSASVTNLSVSTAATTSTNLIVNGISSQTAPMLSVNTSGGTLVMSAGIGTGNAYVTNRSLDVVTTGLIEGNFSVSGIAGIGATLTDLSGSGNNASTNLFTVAMPAVSQFEATTNGIQLRQGTEPTSTHSAYSPSIDLRASGYSTNSSGGRQTEWRIYNAPIPSQNDPTNVIVIEGNVNSNGWSNAFKMFGNGQVFITNGLSINSAVQSGQLYVNGNSTIVSNATIQTVNGSNVTAGDLTVTNTATIQTVNGSNVNVGNLTTTNTITTKYLAFSGSAPTITINTNGAGFGATASVNSSSSDSRGKFTIVTGLGPAGSTKQATVNFNATKSTADIVVIIGCANIAAQNGISKVFATNITTSGFEVWANSTNPTASASDDYFYICFQ